MKNIKKMLNEGWTGQVFSFIMAFIAAFVIYQGAGMALDTDLPIVAVQSNSMVPVFYKGDMLIIMGDDEPEIGDIVVYSTGFQEVPIVHRVVEKTYDDSDVIFSTKGDNNQYSDPWPVGPEQVHGKVVFMIKYLGWPKILLSEALGAIGSGGL